MRGLDAQRGATVQVESVCDLSDHGLFAEQRVGAGVMVSDWQVLTAMHVVECGAEIPLIRVTNRDGRSWRFAPEREWVVGALPTHDGIARIQIASADSLVPKFDPPTVGPDEPIAYDPVYIQTTDSEKVSQMTGWEYGNDDEGHVFTYTSAWGRTEEGDSGSGVYDSDGNLAGIHVGKLEGLGAAARVTLDMVPHK